MQKRAVKSAPLNAPPKPRIDAASEGGVVLSGVVSFLNIVFMFFNRVLKKSEFNINQQIGGGKKWLKAGFRDVFTFKPLSEPLFYKKQNYAKISG